MQFFLYVGYTDTHGPFSGDAPRLVSKYLKSSFFDIPGEEFSRDHGFPSGAPGKSREEDFKSAVPHYYAAVSAIDEQMGRVIDELENIGELDNTLIAYASDHGQMILRDGMKLVARGPGPNGCFADEPWRRKIPN